MSKERFELSCCLFNESNMDFILDKKTNEEYVVLDELVPILNQQDQRIAELEEQLKNAIVPKFKVGEEVYYYHIARNKTYSGCVENIQWFAIGNGIYYRISQLQRDYFWIREDELFATKEEAQAKLKELQGG